MAVFLQIVIGGVTLLVKTAKLGVWVFRKVFQWLRPSDCRQQSNISRVDSKGCRQIIRAEVLDYSRNEFNQHESRARPNNRLVHAFGINNCFTTAENQRCRAFRQLATRLIILNESEWADLRQSVNKVVHSHLASQIKHNLFDLIQIVTMKSILSPLFRFDSSRTDVDAELQALASEINHQWLRSKEALGEESMFANQPQLKQALAVIAPAWDGLDETQNPLNLILPGYETLWRVVLRGFVEVVYRANEPDRANWRRVLEDFARQSTLDQIDKIRANYGEVSACMIVEEAPRLYPPTRRIYRAFKVGVGEPFEASANIEALHRDVASWGSDALKFDPARWLGECDTAEFRKDNFMPFGDQPFVCVAKGRSVKEGAKCLPFGVSMIAVLLGCLVAAAGADTKLRCANGEWKIDEPLKTGREDYREIVLMQSR